MSDIILQKFFEKERWEKAIESGVLKDIDKGELRKLSSPTVRVAMYNAIVTGNYEIAPPHIALIPKDKPGEFREVYINENVDRLFLSIVNDILFEMFPSMIHPSCKSYQKGIGCGKIVQQLSREICEAKGNIIGWKSDLSKFFDTVPIEYIDGVFDQIEAVTGSSAVISIVRKYYHTDLCFDAEGNLVKRYQSLKQGCAVASFLADAVLYDLDEKMTKLNGYYVRYSDDCIFVGQNYSKAMAIMQTHLARMQMTLNPKKIEYLSSDRWFKFLGFAIKGDQISLSRNRIKSFQKEIESRTIKRQTTPQKALNSINQFLYRGDGTYSWATSVLSIINSNEDIDELNKFVVDCLRAVATDKKKIGGLGYESHKPNGVITRGTGRNVTANRQKTEKEIQGYYSITCMRNALLTNRAAYEALIRQM